MTPLLFRGAVAALCCLITVGGLHGEEPAAPVDADHARDMAAGLALFKSGVRETLAKNCLPCHGGDATEGKFSLADRDSLLKGGESGLAVVPRKSGESRLVRLISHAEEPAMPQDASKLPDEDIAAIRRWIDLGAPYDAPLLAADAAEENWTRRKVPPSARDFWAFRPLADVEPPAVDDPDGWCINEIDRFVLAKQREKGLRPNPQADKRTLIRRASFDLLGMPPTPEEVDAFLADESSEAYEHLIDCLLADERFGERWARHWLDVARFAESHGFEQDYDRPYAYHYRDFVIKAFNADLSYDTFVRWQLAGDEIAPDEPLAMMATGFVGAGVFPTQITANEVERTRYDAIDDMAATTGQAFLGLTIGCARCHDHKFDPIPQADYYRFVSTFTTTVRSNVDLPIYPKADTSPAVAAPKPLKVMIASEGVTPIRHHTQGGDFLPETHFLRRGDCDQKEAVADPGFLQVLTAHPDGSAHWQQPPPAGWHTSYRRRALADWITDTEYGPGHLLARVIVNRLWHHHFGRGLVATPNDFGVQGLPPTHPELLDYLARRLIAGGWKLKPIHRLIVTSAAYGQSSGSAESGVRNAESGEDTPHSALPAPHSVDLQNDLLTRFVPRRLEAEALRDSILFVSGRLDPTKYGPGSLEESHTRRSIYFTIKRSRLIPTLTLFDVPEPNVSVGGRQSTTIAPQALHFLNSPQVRASAVALADRATREDPADPLTRAYRLTYGRPPRDDERTTVQIFLDHQTASYSADAKPDAPKLALADICQALLASDEFVYLP
jgi:mono/diheme cytochrome c family protein